MPSSPGALGALSSLVIALLLVGFNAFFVAAELAIVRVRRTRLHELAGQGVDAAHVTILLVDRLNATLATAQVGVTVASLGVGWLAEDAFAFLLANMLPEAFAEGAPLHVVAASTAFGLVTVMHIVLGEMVPKNVALERAESVALSTARPLWVFGVVLRPVIWALGRLATAVTRLLGYESHREPPLSEEELRLVMKESRAGGVITAGEAEIIHRAFEFADNTAAEMMIPAEHVEYLSLARSIEENVAVATRSQHTRFPLCTTELDSVIGIVNMKDAWPRLAEQRSNAMLQHVSRPVTWIERGMPQDRVLQRLQQQKAHMGCVRRDRHGGVLGVITLEEVLDALLGDLREGRG